MTDSDENGDEDMGDNTPRESMDAEIAVVAADGRIATVRIDTTRRGRILKARQARRKRRQEEHVKMLVNKRSQPEDAKGFTDDFRHGSTANAARFRESVEPWESTLTRRQPKLPWPELEPKDLDWLLKLAHDFGVDPEFVVSEMYSPPPRDGGSEADEAPGHRPRPRLRPRSDHRGRTRQSLGFQPRGPAPGSSREGAPGEAHVPHRVPAVHPLLRMASAQ